LNILQFIKVDFVINCTILTTKEKIKKILKTFVLFIQTFKPLNLYTMKNLSLTTVLKTLVTLVVLSLWVFLVAKLVLSFNLTF
jgi:hypothetical protein